MPEASVEVVTRLPRDRTDITSPARYGFEQEQMVAIRRTVAKDCSDAEFVMFLELAARYKLDPFAKQIWAAKMGRGDNAAVAIIVGRDGFLSIAQREDSFLGLDGDVVIEGDKLHIDKDTGEFVHEWGDDHITGAIQGAWAQVRRNDRDKPITFFARIGEYRKGNSDIWQKFPSAMILKCAHSYVLRLAYGISGFTPEEESGIINGTATLAEPQVIEWGDDPVLAEHLERVVAVANDVKKNSYRERKVFSLLHGRTDTERLVFLTELEEHIAKHEGDVPERPPSLRGEEEPVDAEVVSDDRAPVG